MKNINISLSTLNKLEKIKISKNDICTESIVYDFCYRGEAKVLKKLLIANGTSFANKLYTVEMLNTYKEHLPSSFVIPDNLVSLKNEVIGFTVPKINGFTLSTLLKSKEIDAKEKIAFLKQLGSLLDHLESIRQYTDLKDIYINDLNPSNIMLNRNNKEILVIDLDSCKIGSNDCLPARLLTRNSLISNCKNKYNFVSSDNYLGNVVADYNTDMYCYIMIILNYLYGDNLNCVTLDEYYKYLDYLKKIEVDDNLLNCFYSILDSRKNLNPVSYLDTLTYKQIACAKEKIYLKK